MAVTPKKKTDEVLASARKELQAQLVVVREEMGRLANEERVLTRALSSFDGDGSSAAVSADVKTARASTSRQAGRKTSARKPGTSRRRRSSAGKPTAERLKELQALLAAGPKSRNDLAAALKVSPARVQQLLAELGTAVSSQAGGGRRAKLWSLATGGGDGASAAKTTPKPSGGATKPTGK